MASSKTGTWAPEATDIIASAGEALTASQQAAQTASGGIAPRADGLVPMRSGLAATCRNGNGASKQVLMRMPSQS